MARRTARFAAIAALLAAPVPVGAQEQDWSNPDAAIATISAADSAAFGREAKALLEHCRAQTYAEFCRPLLVRIFSESRRRGDASLTRWASRALYDEYYAIEPDTDDPAEWLDKAANEMAVFELSLARPLFGAIAQGAFRDAMAPADLADQLDLAAQHQQRLGRFPLEQILLDGAIAALDRAGEAATERRGELETRRLRAGALLLSNAAIARCAAPGAATLEARTSCAILEGQTGRLRDAEEQLRALGTEALAAGADDALLADIRFQLGRNLMLQERWGEAERLLRSALDLLNPEGVDKPYYQAPAQTLAGRRAAGFLDASLAIQGKDRLRTGFDESRRIGEALGLFYGVEARRWEALGWAADAERLQREIDAGRLRWEGGVWQSLMTRYRTALGDVGQLWGQDDPLTGYYRIKEAEASERFLTEGFREAASPDYIAREITPGFERGLAALQRMPAGNVEYGDGFHAGALHWKRENRDLGRAYGLCRKAVDGVRTGLDSQREFDAVAQRRLKQAAPIFADCIGVMWNARAFDDTAAQDAR